jgi:hypothetical protein
LMNLGNTIYSFGSLPSISYLLFREIMISYAS